MTCLTTSDVIGIPGGWEEYDKSIKEVLGVDLLTLAAMSQDKPVEQVQAGLANRRLAAISISSGVGVVSGFAESLASIGRHLGMDAKVMSRPDRDGFREAAKWRADFVISADDHRFLARESSRGLTANNNPATSRVFVTALELMNGGSLKEREVVVLGLGIIGLGAASYLCDLGAYPLMYDPDPKRATAAQGEIREGEIIRDQTQLAEVLGRTNLIYDATPVLAALPESLWPAEAVVSAPGVPLSWPLDWLSGSSKRRLWHDPLQSGTAAMLAKLA